MTLVPNIRAFWYAAKCTNLPCMYDQTGARSSASGFSARGVALGSTTPLFKEEGGRGKVEGVTGPTAAVAAAAAAAAAA